jgi:hypothetical protein
MATRKSKSTTESAPRKARKPRTVTPRANDEGEPQTRYLMPAAGGTYIRSANGALREVKDAHELAKLHGVKVETPAQARRRAKDAEDVTQTEPVPMPAADETPTAKE